MECCRSILSDAKCLAHLDRKAAHEVGVSVMDEQFGESHTFEHVFQVQLGNSFSCYRFVAWNKDYCFGAVMIRDHEY